MAKLFVTSINLNKNELQNARIQNLSANPSNAVAGQIYFNNVSNELRTYDGTQWVGAGSIQYGLEADRPTASKGGLLYATTDTKVMYLDNGTSWLQVGIGTDTTDVLLNKTFGDRTYFGVDNNHASYIEGEVEGTGNLTIQGGDDLTLQTQAGDIILNADGSSYIGSAAPGNRIVTVDELNSGDVIQSVTGTTGEVDATTDGSGNVTVGLPNTVQVHTGLIVGQDAVAETNQNGEFTVKKADGSNSFDVDSTGTTINGTLEIQDGSGNPKLNISYSGTGATRITSSDDIAIRSQSGDIILYPGNDTSWGGDGGTGKAYVHWGNDATGAGPENEITTAGNAQSITNKTVNDELYFTNPSTQPNDGGIKIDDNTENFEIRAYTANLNLHSNYGDINILPDGVTNVESNLNVYGPLQVPYIAGSSLNAADGTLELGDGSGLSTIHINGATKNIEILPDASAKAFYGSAATAGNEIAKISDLQALSSGLNWKQAVNLLYDDATPTLSGDTTLTPLTIDGHATLGTSEIGYRILVAYGADAGIYVYNESGTTWTLDRTTDANEFTELIGAAVFVMEGTQYGSTSWVQSNHYIVDFANQEWIQFSGQGTYIGSNSIQVDGNQINAVVNSDAGLGIDGDGIHVKLNTDKGLEFRSGTGAIQVKLGTGLVVDGSGNITNDTTNGYGVRKYAVTIDGDVSATTITCDHNFGTEDVTVQVYLATGSKAQVEADVEHTDGNTITIKLAQTPAAMGLGALRVVVIG